MSYIIGSSDKEWKNIKLLLLQKKKTRLLLWANITEEAENIERSILEDLTGQIYQKRCHHTPQDIGIPNNGKKQGYETPMGMHYKVKLGYNRKNSKVRYIS